MPRSASKEPPVEPVLEGRSSIRSSARAVYSSSLAAVAVAVIMPMLPSSNTDSWTSPGRDWIQNEIEVQSSLHVTPFTAAACEVQVGVGAGNAAFSLSPSSLKSVKSLAICLATPSEPPFEERASMPARPQPQSARSSYTAAAAIKGMADDGDDLRALQQIVHGRWAVWSRRVRRRRLAMRLDAVALMINKCFFHLILHTVCGQFGCLLSFVCCLLCICAVRISSFVMYLKKPTVTV